MFSKYSINNMYYRYCAITYSCTCFLLVRCPRLPSKVFQIFKQAGSTSPRAGYWEGPPRLKSREGQHCSGMYKQKDGVALIKGLEGRTPPENALFRRHASGNHRTSTKATSPQRTEARCCSAYSRKCSRYISISKQNA